MISGKLIGTTPNNCKYIIYQDSPTGFHFTVTKTVAGNSITMYDWLDSPESLEALHAYVNEVALELDKPVETTYLPLIPIEESSDEQITPDIQLEELPDES